MTIAKKRVSLYATVLIQLLHDLFGYAYDYRDPCHGDSDVRTLIKYGRTLSECKHYTEFLNVDIEQAKAIRRAIVKHVHDDVVCTQVLQAAFEKLIESSRKIELTE